jgi:hypothetical protein
MTFSLPFRAAVTTMGLFRITLGLAPFVAAGPAARLLGFPGAHDTATTRLMGRLFGVRDVGLGVLAFYALAHPETAAFLFLFNAAMDAGDLLAITIPLVRRQGIDRAAVMSAVMALGGMTGWLIAWALAR